MIAFIGTGLLGSNFVKAMLRKGLNVNVWNRTPSKARALEADGAHCFEHITDAVAGVQRIHLTLKDDAAIDEVLQMAAPGLAPGATIIDHTTTSVDGAVRRTAYWKSQGYTYLHAPVFMGPVNALESTGTILLSGDQDVAARWTPELSTMTGKVINFGEVTGKAAGMKLIGNSFIVNMTAGIADMLILAKAMNIPEDDLTGLFDSWNPGAMVPARLKKMTSRTFDQPTWELDMARKDTRLMMEEGAKGSLPLIVIPGIAATMDDYIARGHGNKDYTVIGKDAL